MAQPAGSASASCWTAACRASNGTLRPRCPLALGVVLAEEIVSRYGRLGQDRSERTGFERAVIRHGQSRLGAVGVDTRHGDMVSFSDENETEPLKGSDYVAYGSVDGELGH